MSKVNEINTFLPHNNPFTERAYWQKGKMKCNTLLFKYLLLFGILVGFTILPFSSQGKERTVQFIKNAGQWKGDFLYRAGIPGGKLFVEKNTLTYLFWDTEKLESYHHRKEPPGKLRFHAIRLKFINANDHPELITGDPEVTRYSYFPGNDPGRWVSGLKGYRKLVIKNLYDGINLELKGEVRGLKYNFHLAAGANPKDIKIQYEGMEDLYLEKGDFFLVTSLNELKEEKPVAYQISGKEKIDVPVRFRLRKNRLSFELPGSYRQDLPLVIDPRVIFATYSGSHADNFGFTGTFDKQGHAYSGGTVYAPGFPTTTGAFQQDFAGGQSTSLAGDAARDVGILKYSPNGSQLRYATYLGGNHNEQPHSMVVNHKGQLVVFGTTRSNDFPVKGNAYDPSYNGREDLFVAILNPNGSKLAASTFIGGNGDDGKNGEYRSNTPRDYLNRSPLGYNYGDNYRGEVIVDSSDNILIASCTRSTDFPATARAPQKRFNGGYQDGCVIKFNYDLTTLNWATYLGGNRDDAAYSLHLDDDQNVYVGGGTRSTDFPKAGRGAYKKFQGGTVDGFITYITRDGTRITKSSYLGTGAYDQVFFVQVDIEGSVYVTGQTEGEYLIKNVDVSHKNSGQFITKLNASLDQIIYSTVFGTGKGTPDITPTAFLVDICQNVYVSGWGGKTNEYSRGKGTSTKGLPLTGNAYQKTTDGSDFYLVVFKKDMDSLLYATFLGGDKAHEHVDGGTSRFDKNGMVYQSICGGCRGYSDFPVTPNAWSKTNNSDNCNNAFVKLKLDVANNPPKYNNQVIKVTATDTINFKVDITDPNDNDSVYMDFSGDIFGSGKFPRPHAKMSKASGVKNIRSRLYWRTSCAHLGVDTYYVNLQMRDIGCPKPKSSQGKIKIVIEPPPVFDPPKIFCSRVQRKHTIKLTWREFYTDKYFKHYLLYRRDSSGNLLVLDTVENPQNNSYRDSTAVNHHNIEYCYYLKSVNVCDETGPSSYQICTGPGNAQEPAKRFIYRATVVDNNNVKLQWNRSSEPDFKSYDIYRKRNHPKKIYKPYKTIPDPNDTVFIDTNVNVNKSSYCYKIIANDHCGFFSRKSNEGCTILLRGKSSPFQHDLMWNPYQEWPEGVKKYTVARRDPLFDKQFKTIGSVDGHQQEYTDDELNIDVGAYWYRVKARENGHSKTKPGDTLTSLSNEVYLYQKPLLHVPNAFTPNKDGYNDSWGIKDVFVKDFHIRVYNRWGQKVFESNNKFEDWSGWFRDKDESKKFDNVFVYIIIYTGWDNSTHYKKGTVTLLK